MKKIETVDLIKNTDELVCRCRYVQRLLSEYECKATTSIKHAKTQKEIESLLKKAQSDLEYFTSEIKKNTLDF
jgi:hypothetical protein